MKEVKSLDYELLWELVKDCRRSDRTLAKVLKSSQPTITRRRARLEKNFIDGYTAIPKWEKLGYEIFAFTFIKSDVVTRPPEKQKAAEKRIKEWMMRHPNVLASGRGWGMGMNGFMISLHRSYTDFQEFISKAQSEIGDLASESESFLVSITGLSATKPFHFKYLAEAK
jgi:DNA-binding Lrp family transcriptional regulator